MVDARLRATWSRWLIAAHMGLIEKTVRNALWLLLFAALDVAAALWTAKALRQMSVTRLQPA